MIKRLFYSTLLCFLFSSASLAQDERIDADQTAGCDSLLVRFTLEDARALETYASIEWDFGDGGTASNTLNPAHQYTDPGLYTVQCRLDGARLISNSDFIAVGLTPYADFTFADSIPDDDILEYAFSAAYFQPIQGIGLSYFWRFPDGSTTEDSLARHTFTEENIYNVFLEVKDANGCADTIVKRVPVSRKLLVPNVFSPNGDEINDYFRVTTPGDYNYSLRIFTRAGLQVHYTYSPEIVWDGRTSGGAEVPEGVYFYLIESSDTPVNTEMSGFLHLFR